ncbi:hypothetical protein AVEN_241068-1 [Araneus ventricosus]|uniref:Histone-lysine N-methyltransferase SETMAR n=1 Tax=Araneus ventricosus TaxID=182803 RepID=A0A4Y2KGU3_ARAVE|nr:hypothetical protein AVEN_241068-1 [Araneus ventricosus]
MALWFLLHDNVRLHIATLVKRFLVENGVNELSHPPYSPDLSPPGIFFFPKLKVALKGRRFTDIKHILAAVTRELKVIPAEEFQELLKICTHIVRGVHSVRRVLVYRIVNSFQVRPTLYKISPYSLVTPCIMSFLLSVTALVRTVTVNRSYTELRCQTSFPRWM